MSKRKPTVDQNYTNNMTNEKNGDERFTNRGKRTGWREGHVSVRRSAQEKSEFV